MYGGTFYFNNYVTPLTQTTITISNSKAYNNGGTIYITGTTANTIALDSLTITNTNALGNGGTVYVSNPS
jgi:hypothetical protein